MRRILIAFFALAAIAGCSGSRDIQKKLDAKRERIREDLGLVHETAPVPVGVIKVEACTGVESFSYVGRAESSKNAVVVAPCSGVVRRMNVTPGRRVSRGEVIASMNSERLVSAHEAAKATLTQAEDALERVEKVYSSGSVSEIKMMEVRTRVEQARASEKAARSALEDCEVKAPFSGVIGEVYAHEGQNLPLTSPLVQIIDNADVEVHFNVPESEYLMIRVGDRAEIEVPALGRSIWGTVSAKGVDASRLSHSYDFTLRGLSDASGLVAGMVCKVRMKSGGERSIVIPASAVMTDMQGRYIWGVTPENTVCKTYIEVGGYSGNGVVVSEGLSEGDMVIVEGSRKVSTGMEVKVQL